MRAWGGRRYVSLRTRAVSRAIARGWHQPRRGIARRCDTRGRRTDGRLSLVLWCLLSALCSFVFSGVPARRRPQCVARPTQRDRPPRMRWNPLTMPSGQRCMPRRWRLHVALRRKRRTTNDHRNKGVQPACATQAFACPAALPEWSAGRTQGDTVLGTHTLRNYEDPSASETPLSPRVRLLVDAVAGPQAH